MSIKGLALAATVAVLGVGLGGCVDGGPYYGGYGYSDYYGPYSGGYYGPYYGGVVYGGYYDRYHRHHYYNGHHGHWDHHRGDHDPHTSARYSGNASNLSRGPNVSYRGGSGRRYHHHGGMNDEQ